MLRIILTLSLTFATLTFQLQAQDCNPLSDNIALGGTAHDPGFQNASSIQASATLSNGNFVVVWETRDGVDGNGTGAYFQVFNESGVAVTSAATLYADVNADGTGNQGSFGPKVIALENGGFVAAWDSEDGPGDVGPTGDEQQDVFFRIFNNAGAPITGSNRININNQEDKVEFLLPLDNGEFAILTSIEEASSGNNDDYFIHTYTAQGTAKATGVKIADDAHDASFQDINSTQAMVDLGNGRLAVTWESRDGVDGNGAGGFLRIFNSDGTGAAIIVPYLDINPSATGEQALFGSRVTVLEGGNIVMTWNSTGGPGDVDQDLYYRVYNNSGSPVSATMKINSDQTAGRQALDGIMPLAGGNFAILYKLQNGLDDLFVRTFGPTGTPNGASVEISGGLHSSVFAVVASNNTGFAPLDNGNFVVSWGARGGADGDQSGAYYRIFNATGTAVTGVSTVYSDVNAVGTGNQAAFGPTLAKLAGGFAIAWESEEGPGDVQQDIYHRAFNEDGTPFCGTVKSNAGNDNQTHRLEFVQPLNNGNFVVSYNDTDRGADNSAQNDLFIRVTGGVAQPSVCPTIGSVSIEPMAFCDGDSVTVTVSGLANMAAADNGDQDFGIILENALDFFGNSPYPTISIPTTPNITFDQLTNDGTTAIIENFRPGFPSGNPMLVAYLSPNPTDENCRPFVEITMNASADPFVSFTAPDDIFENAGVQTGLGGGSPAGGVYSGPGVSDDGNGMTYSFDPTAAGGLGTYTITYTFTNEGGCVNSASDGLAVIENALVISPIGAINGVDSLGVALLLDQAVAIQGVVHCNNFSGDEMEYSFFVIDSLGDGIFVFASEAIGDYRATEGDELIIAGVLKQFDGNLEINPTEITLLSQNNGLQDPLLTSVLNESLENKYVTLEMTDVIQDQIELIDFEDGNAFVVFPTTQDTFVLFITPGSGISIEFINEFIATMNVDRFLITGFVLQLDGAQPFDDDYVLLPCSVPSLDFVSDVNEPVWARELRVFPNPTSYEVNINAPVDIEQLRVVSIQGRLIQTQVINSPTHTLDMSTLPSGVYQIQLINKDGVVNRQVVKQ